MSRHASSKPVRESAPEWVPLLPREVESKVVELAKEGKQPAVIGLILRDSYGIPSVQELTGKKIQQILKDAGLGGKLPQDLQNLIQRSIALQEHLAGNPRDLHNLRGLELMQKDEYLEVTPTSVRLRKIYLTESDRAKAARKE